MRCAIDLDDGVDYTQCPRCDGHVVASEPAPRTRSTSSTRLPTPRTASSAVLLVLVAVQLVLALVAPHDVPYLAPLLVIAQLAALPGVILAVLWIPTVRALTDERTRILHGLEHATVAVLEERGILVDHAVTLPGVFDLALANDGRSSQLVSAIDDAVATAALRVSLGETALVYTDRCGTSRLVAELGTSLVVAAAGAIALIAGLAPGYAFALTIAGLALARLTSLRLGRLAQRYLTVSTRRARTYIGRIEPEVAVDGRWLYYTVHVEVIV